MKKNKTTSKLSIFTHINNSTKMKIKNIFEKSISDEIIARIEKLTPETQTNWGKMNVAQMLAHCNVTYEMVYTDKHPKATGIKRFLLKAFVKNIVVGEKPYKKNERTAPIFIISDSKEFEIEKNRLIEFINKTQELGASHFENKESNSFGPLKSSEWNTMFYKHLDHHLGQFGV
jgi:hypothetical protein